MMPALENARSTVSRFSTQTSTSRTLSVSSKTITEKAQSITTESLPKPINVFYVWYAELCRRQNTVPVGAVRPQNLKNEQILEFVADRIKVEDWPPVINALRLDTSLHVIVIHSRLGGQKIIEDADTIDKVKKIKKWFGAICTKHILKSLLTALGNCLKRTSVLTCLELDGLPLTREYLLILMKALQANRTIKYLSFKSCPIGDDGCYEICDVLHSLPNVEVLNLSGCGLGPKSAEHLSKLIKYQQINRYCESWHSSLRYEDPVVNNMKGLKRITINNNPKIGDEGLEFILNELDDDLWIKAIDMQRCNISENIAGKLIDVIDYSRSLEVADFRHNNLAPSSVERILEILKCKVGEYDDNESTYQWCFTSTTLAPSNFESVYGTAATTTKVSVPAPVKPSKPSTNITNNKVTFKRQATMPDIPVPSRNTIIVQKDNKEKINNLVKPDNASLLKAKDQLMELYERLKEESTKRQQAEEMCEKLKKQVDELMNQQKHQMILKEFDNMKQYIGNFISFVKEHGKYDDHGPMLTELQRALDEVHVLAKPYETIIKDLNLQPANETIKEGQVEEKEEESDDNKDAKLQTLFKNMLGNQTEDVDEEEDLDFGMELDFPNSEISESKTEVSVIAESDSPRSTDSESVETLKRMLEELSQDQENKSGVDDDYSTISVSSTEEHAPLKLVINMNNSQK